MPDPHSAVVDPETPIAGASTGGTRDVGGAYFVLAGTLLGILFVKAEVLTWYRIQEMFRFQSFHMYGVIAGALATAMAGLQLIRRFQLHSWNGQTIVVPAKLHTPLGIRYWVGGAIFGLGWGLLGACPGPMFALLGAGVTAITVAILGAMAGTWVYALLQPRLPH